MFCGGLGCVFLAITVICMIVRWFRIVHGIYYLRVADLMSFRLRVVFNLSDKIKTFGSQWMKPDLALSSKKLWKIDQPFLQTTQVLTYL